MSEPLIDIRPDHWVIVAGILRRHVPDREVWAFGSRAKWNAKEYSDLDLAVIGKTPLSLSVSAALADDFAESDLPFKVDVVDWATTSESFRKIIERDKVVVQAGSKSLGTGGEWQVFPFERLLAEPVRNGVYKPKSFHGRGAKIVNMGELFAHPRLRAVPMKRVELSRSESERFTLSKGDLLFARRSLVAEGAGKCSVVLDIDEPTTFESSIIRARPDSAKAEPLFLYYYFNSTAGLHRLDTIRRQVAVAGITGSDLSRLEIPIPPLPEQRAIAHILGTLDDKIELNRRMSETLEAMARALFKSWFVDFDPVRAKQAKNVGWVSPSGRNPPDKADGGLRGCAANPPYELPRHILDLFPARLVDSELGEIPEGWEVVPLPKAIEVNPTRSLRKGVVARYLDMANMPTQGHTPDGVIDRPFGSGMRFVNGDTLVARITPCLENGKTAYVDFLEDDHVGWGSTEYIVLRPKTPLPAEFAYCLARGTEFRNFAIQSMTGSSGRQRVPAESLSHFHMVAPPKPVAELFGRLIKPLFARASGGAKEARTLAALRSALLPMLISGELRVKDAERVAVGGA